MSIDGEINTSVHHFAGVNPIGSAAIILRKRLLQQTIFGGFVEVIDREAQTMGKRCEVDTYVELVCFLPSEVGGCATCARPKAGILG